MTFVDVAVVGLCLLLTVELSITRLLLRQVRWLSQLHSEPSEQWPESGIRLGMKLPKFSLSSLSTGEVVTDEKLHGQFASFLFLASTDIACGELRSLYTNIEAMLEHAEERLYVVCEGGEKDAQWLRDHAHISRIYGDRVHILVADDSALRAAIGVKSTPSSAMFDASSRVLKVGQELRKQGNVAAGSHVS